MASTRVLAGVSSPTYPDRGDLLPDIVLGLTDSKPVRPSDFKGRSNLVLILAGATGDELLAAIARRHRDFTEGTGLVIAVLRCSPAEAERLKRRNGWPFFVLADPDGKSHERLGAADAEGHDAIAIYVTDRWGEIYLASRTVHGDSRPEEGDILEWLTFIDLQCPECALEDWPAR